MFLLANIRPSPAFTFCLVMGLCGCSFEGGDNSDVKPEPSAPAVSESEAFVVAEPSGLVVPVTLPAEPLPIVSPEQAEAPVVQQTLRDDQAARATILAERESLVAETREVWRQAQHKARQRSPASPAPGNSGMAMPMMFDQLMVSPSRSNAPREGEDSTHAAFDRVVALRRQIDELDAQLTTGQRPSPAQTSLLGNNEKAKPALKKQPITSWKRASARPHSARLMIGDHTELPLTGMQVNVQIEGFRARVVVDAYYRNDQGRSYEGTFKLRLPNGANPYFFAFGQTTFQTPNGVEQPVFFDAQEVQQIRATPQEIMALRQASWQEPKQARMVPKEKAAHAYHETVRRRIDPALLEWSGAGIFSARVFPLAPGKLHRIVLGYELNLLPLGNDLEYRFDVPAGVPKSVVDLQVRKIPGAAIEILPKGDTDATDPEHLYRRFNDPEVALIQVRIKHPGTLLLQGNDADTGDYFATQVQPSLSAQATSGAPSAVFLVDLSLSANPDQFAIWLTLLDKILTNNRDSLKHFAVCFFNIETFWWQEDFVANTPENVRALLQYSNALALEGATDLAAALLEGSQPGWLDSTKKAQRWDLFLLSDGAITWGEKNLWRLSQTLDKGHADALFAYRTGMAGTDQRVLNHLTRERGGALFSVVGQAEINKAARAHRSRPWLIDALRLAGGQDLLLAGRPNSLFPGQNLLLVGRGTIAPGAKVELMLRQGQQQQRLTIPIQQRLRSALTPRIYGQVAVGQLEAFGAHTAPTAKSYATHFRVTGQTCSLLMLEQEADYLRFNIKPEEDAFVVQETPVAPLIAKVLAKIGSALGNAKADFLAWLHSMTTLPGFQFEPSAAYQLALKKMPESAFEVARSPLLVSHHARQGIPAKVRQQLKSKQLDYDSIMQEAQRRLQSYGRADALRALSSLVEQQPGDSVLARDVAFTAMSWGLPGHAYDLLHRVAKARPYEPQTYQALAQVLASTGRSDLALAYYEVGLSGHWKARYGEFRKIHGLNYLHFLRQIEQGRLPTSVPSYVTARIRSVRKEFDPGRVDLMVTISWNTDNTDVDLHVTEPNGTLCYYGHRQTRIGGRLTQDVTRGYGPERYTLAKAKPGNYRIQAKYYASNRNRTQTRTKVFATIIQGWGTPQERITQKTVTLRYGSSMHDIDLVKVVE